MLPVLNIGSFVIPTAGLVIILGAWVCLSVVERAATYLRQDAEQTYAVAATAVFAGAVGARLTFVFQYWPAFQANPLAIIWPLNSGYNIWGGLFIGAAGAFFYARARRLAWAPLLDALAPGVLLGFLVVSVADFLGGPGYGTLTNMPWGIAQYGLRRHPVHLYETAVALAALALWWRLGSRAAGIGRAAASGRAFLASLTLYSAGRLFVDAYRENAWLVAGGFHGLQIICLLAALAGLFLLGRPAKTAVTEPDR